jgi:hypothetical protein
VPVVAGMAGSACSRLRFARSALGQGPALRPKPGCGRTGSSSRPAAAVPAWTGQNVPDTPEPTARAVGGRSSFGHRRRWWRASEIAHEVIESFLMLGFAQAGQVGVDGGDHRALVTEVARCA